MTILLMVWQKDDQIKKQIEESKRVLITFSPTGGGDAIAAACALKSYLEKIHKQADIVCSDFVLPKNIKFIKKASEIKNKLADLRKFTITLNAKKQQIKELSYDIKDGYLRVFITPKQGSLSRQHVSTAQSDFKYDLIFTIKTPNIKALGDTYSIDPDFFHQTTIINIDHNANNEHHGQINLIDLTASSGSEIIYNLLRRIGAENIDKEIATYLLAGIIHETRSFKGYNTKPHTLQTASKLIGLGADREQIIANLYRTRSISLLKLWGKTLQHLQIHHDILGVSVITRDDFIRSGTNEQDLFEVINELIEDSPEIPNLLILYEDTQISGKIKGILKTDKKNNAQKIVYKYKPTGSPNSAHFTVMDTQISQLKDRLLKELRSELN